MKSNLAILLFQPLLRDTIISITSVCMRDCHVINKLDRWVSIEYSGFLLQKRRHRCQVDAYKL